MSGLNRIKKLLEADAPIKWLFAGDSITHGAYHTFGFRDYVEHFAELIRWEHRRYRDCIMTTAASGWTISNLADDLEWSALQHSSQVVSLNFGMNDCIAGPDGVEEFSRTYRKVLDRISQSHEPAFILHTPNSILYTPDSGRSGLPQYAEAVRRLAVDYDAVLVDHEKDWLETEQRQALMFWLSDAIHPNEYGHRAMARTLFCALGLFDSQSPTGRLFIP